MSEGSAIVTVSEFEPVKALVLDRFTNDHTRRAYSRALDDFFLWWNAQGRPALSKAVVQRFRAYLHDSGLAAATITQRMSAIRALASEAADNGLIEQSAAFGISKVKGMKASGTRAGNWLTKEQAQELLNAPDTGTLKGLRDRAILAVMLGAGLRRSEVAALTFDHIQQRDGRWVILDLIGKGERMRSVPIPSWTKAAIDAWARAAGLSGGRVFRAVNRYGRTLDRRSSGITAQAVYNVVAEYAGALGFDLAAHDLRRTYAKLARKGGADLAQIQLTLGHASIKTTERYLGEELDLTDAPCDKLGLRLG